MIEHHTVPVTIKSEDGSQECEAELHVNAEYFYACASSFHEPGHPAGYEVYSIAIKAPLSVSELNGAFLFGIRVEGKEEREVWMDLRVVPKGYLVPLDDEGLRDDLAGYLMDAKS